MNPRCQAKRGFFMLRDCDGAAVVECTQCHRRMCLDHAVAGLPTCKECDGRAKERDVNEDGWVYSYRDRYYRSNAYAPIYFGHHHHTYYDDYDVRSFDTRDTGDADSLRDDADFHDS